MELQHFRQLDGLRALAVGLVVFHHYSNVDFLAGQGPGRLGVFTFFTLSGFLITRILLRSRAGAEDVPRAKGQVMRSFYARRALRIFPLYYGSIVLLLLMGFNDARKYLLSLVTYTANFAMAQADEWPYSVSHFWSLAVEEQFYVLWPLFVVFLPRRMLAMVCAVGMVLATVARLLMVASGVDGVALWVLPFAVMDVLLIGALLAVVAEDRPAWLPKPSTFRWVALISCIAWFAFPEVVDTSNDSFWWVAHQSVIALFGGCLVFAAVSGVPGIAGRLLESRVAVFLGRISYGIYVFHVIVAVIFVRAIEKLQLQWVSADHYLLVATFWVVVTIVVSWLSWTFFESRFNRLKVRFPYLPNSVEIESPVSSSVRDEP